MIGKQVIPKYYNYTERKYLQTQYYKYIIYLYQSSTLYVGMAPKNMVADTAEISGNIYTEISFK